MKILFSLLYLSPLFTHRNRQRWFFPFILFCVIFTSDALANLHWNKSDTKLQLKRGNKIVWGFNHDKAESKPFFHPINLADGTQVTRFEPHSEEHPWHRGLWFSFKYINGVNYWEENKQTRQSDGKTEILDTEIETYNDFSALIKMTLAYREEGQAILLKEQRYLAISAPDQEGNFYIDWDSKFKAAQKILLDRTPLIHEPEGKSWGGYAGISLRLAKPLDKEWQFLTSGKTTPKNVHGADKSWVYFGNKKQGVSIFQHSNNNFLDNTRWYIAPGMPYMGPAFLFNKGISVNANEAWRFRYRVAFYSTEYSKENIDKAFKDFVKDKVDLVSLGKNLFHEQGCVECHAVKKNSAAIKSGPKLFGLAQLPAQSKIVLEAGAQRKTIIADYDYIKESIRNPNKKIAIDKKGEAHHPIMPAYNEEKLNAQAVDAIYFYLLTLNPKDTRGPGVKWQTVSRSHGSQFDNEQLVGDQAVIARNLLPGQSSRSIHVGLPNKTNYSFDTSRLAVRKIWWGGFMDVTAERTGRAHPGHVRLADGAIDWPNVDTLLQPLNKKLQLINQDFISWPVFDNTEDLARFEKKQYAIDDTTSYLKRIKKQKQQFLGVNTLDKMNPSLKYAINGTQYEQTTSINKDGSVTFAFKTSGKRNKLNFQLAQSLIDRYNFSQGTIDKNGIWTVEHHSTNQFSITLWPKAVPASPKGKKNSKEQYDQQAVVWTSNIPISLPLGYRLETAEPPKDRFGRAQLFEPLGIDFNEDGTSVLATRTAGVWKIKNNSWHFFAEGFHDPLGVSIENADASSIIITHKPEITRVIDSDRDGYADQFNTLSDDWRFAGNYCEYIHGPAIDADGDFHININLAHGYGRRANGTYMASTGGYDGWNVKITRDGKFIPWASGLRSPAGLDFIDDMLFYTENQGSFVGTSKMFIINKGDYFGYPAALVDHDRYRGKSLDNWQEINKAVEKPVVFFPHGLVANSPGHPTKSPGDNRFGPFVGQIFVGDQTQSNIVRVSIENIEGQWQGAVMPFMRGLRSGAMRLAFSPEGQLWVGQTGRGWAASGQQSHALQRIIWDAQESEWPFEILDVKLRKQGFLINFTDTVNPDSNLENLVSVTSWYYVDSNEYGSERYEVKEHTFKARLEQDNKSIVLTVDTLQEDRIYEIVTRVKSTRETSPTGGKAYYTLNKRLSSVVY